MRTLFGGTIALSLVVVLIGGCDLLKKKTAADAGADAEVAEVADAEPAPAPAAIATNEGDVERFPDETKLANVAATTQRTYNVREAPPVGTVILGLGKGVAVTQIAQREKYFLIVFEDPKTPGAKKMGWVHADAFSAQLVEVKPLKCTAGEIALFGDTPFCGKLCSADADCPPTAAGASQACKGSANKLLPSGKAGDGVTVCTVFHVHDAGASPAPPTPPVADAGRFIIPFIVDGGRLSVLFDAAPPTPPPTPPPAPPGGADVVPPVGGACSAGFVLVKKTNKCHRTCASGPGACKSVCIKCDPDHKKVCGEAREQCR